jgi:alpha-ribazole phosphatase
MFAVVGIAEDFGYHVADSLISRNVMSEHRLYLIRHGHTVWNGPPHRIQGPYHSELSEDGKAAARELGRQLNAPDRIVSSPADRCLQTVDCMFGREPDHVDERLVEIYLGWFCGKLATEVWERDAAAWDAWRHRPARTRPGGDGETLSEVQARFVAAVKEVQASVEEGEKVLIATHGGCLRTLICYDRAAPLDMYPDISMDNLSMFRLMGRRLEPGGLNVNRVSPEEFV